MMRFNGSFGGWLKQRRKALDLTQTELADQIGYSVVTIRKIEGDAIRPSKQIAEHLADVLAISSAERADFIAYARGSTGNLPTLPIQNGSQAAFQTLPPQPTPFIGRIDELAQIADLLNDPQCRLLTLVGVGGVGKTRLALQAAAQMIGAFKDGACFVALVSVASPDLLASAIGEALKITFYGAEDPKIQLCNYFRGKHLLLVLDNFEHLVEGTGLIADLLANAPRLKILATSRERLNLQEEWALPVEGLAFPDAGTDDEIGSYSAVQLFLQSARRVQPGFSLTENAEAVIGICQAVEGMPLALELSAAWLRVMPCPQIAGGIRQALDFLATPFRNVPERHRNLRAVFDHSWALLSEGERGVLASLSVFQGGCTLEAAEQVAGASLVMLAGLVDKSLVRVNPSGRYDLHELLRQYAGSRLAEYDEPETRRRHYDFFLSLAEQGSTGPITGAWLDRLEAEENNLRAALAWSLDGGEPELGLRLAGALASFWDYRNRTSEGYEWLDRALRSSSNASASLRAAALNRAVCLAWHLPGDARISLCEQALAFARQINDKRNIAWGTAYLARFLRSQRGADPNDDHVLALLDEAETLFREIDDITGLIFVAGRQAEVATDRGDYGRALAQFEEVLALARETGDVIGEAWSLFHMSYVTSIQGDFERTVALCQESLPLLRELKIQPGQVEALYRLGVVSCAEGNYAQAGKHWLEGLTLIQAFGVGTWDEQLTYLFDHLGGLAAARHDPIRAAKLLGVGAPYKRRADLRNYYSGGFYYDFSDDIAAARAQIGEAAFEAAFAEGSTMTLEEAIAYAFEGSNSP